MNRFILTMAIVISFGAAHLANGQVKDDMNLRLATAWNRAIYGDTVNDTEEKDVDRNQISWFIGYFEGSLNLSTPEFWQDGLRNARIGLGQRILFQIPDNLEGDFGLRRRKDDLAEWKTDNFSLGFKNGKIRKPLYVQKEFPDVMSNVQVVEQGDYIVVCGTVSAFEPIIVVCVNKAEKKIAWKSKLTLNSGVGIGSGRSIHINKLLLDGDRAHIFGFRNDYCYAGGFNLEDGTIAFKFGSGQTPSRESGREED